MRKVSNIWHLDNISLIGYDLAKSCHQMLARDRIERAVYEKEGLRQPLQRCHPTLAIFLPFLHISDQLVCDQLSVIVFEQPHKIVQLFNGGFCAEPKDRGEARRKTRIGNKPPEILSDRAYQQLLRQYGPMRLWEQCTV